MALPCPIRASEDFFEGSGIDAHATADLDCRQLAPLYHLVEEGLGDLEAPCDLGNTEEPTPLATQSASAFSASPIAAVSDVW